ncbi:prepilin-type cleavage/methylation domain-containing protein [Gammaproteobacteria bacterium ESL0073]|nr:prepilin-type cleavage/methylation domain-containing protein [Gammaproteobacteria bacterium ESL0073]
MKKISEGFSLIELMAVIAIVAILAAIAIPMYLDYLTRAKLAEVFTVASSVKSRVVEYYSFSHQCPVNTGGNSEIAPTDYATAIIQEINVVSSSGGCDINVKIKQDAALASEVRGKTISLQLVPANISGAFAWTCTSDMSSNDIGRYLPKVCN